ncbi:SRPBCC family protein [Fusobacterium polymorphum]|uniref:Polyketide cyclase n=1 Tax=Fusobacterium nucleatum subsp. polymorphum TaxID=76857 RepID=A0A246EGG5_FUSNP|nr:MULTISPECIES: polyketide cyclase [Fusobacterium]OWP25702.1 polyketide cyclase [Fusobacterium polymorphum]PHI10287.1 polyketide cyclase [Fusobacterium polymorphum]WCB32355.1 polyketide cyclase [Fusobacterium nucleatum]
MEFSFKIKINAKKEKVWEYYADINKWYIWEEDLKDIKLNGEFKTGSKGIMKLENMPPLEYILTSVKENKEFWDRTDIPLGSIHFGHEIFEEDRNSVSIKHTVRLESTIISEENIEFLKGIFSDVPHSMMLLKKSVEE